MTVSPSIAPASSMHALPTHPASMPGMDARKNVQTVLAASPPASLQPKTPRLLTF